MSKTRVRQVVVIVLVSLIPALYVYLYLSAFWDPSAHMSDITIAVVNSDKGIQANGTSKNLGDGIVQNLKQSKTIKWVFTDKLDADDGLKKQDYYAELIIPGDFTKRISSAGQDKKEQGILYYKIDVKRGTLGTTLLSSIFTNLKENISRNISREAAANLIFRFEELPKDMHKLGEGLNQIDMGLKQLLKGVLVYPGLPVMLKDSVTKLDSGITQIKDSVNNSVSILNSNVSKLKGLDEFISDPVRLEASDNANTKTGMSFAPFMISIALYIGGIMVFIGIYCDEKNRFRKHISKRLQLDAGLLNYLLVGVIQSFIVTFASIHMVGIEVDDRLLFYCISMISSLAFVSIVELLIVLFKDGGKLFGLILMILQLTTCSGVFPSDLTPGFFKALHPFMPMSYTVDAFKNVLFSTDSTRLVYCIIVLLGIFIVCTVLALFISHISEKKNSNKNSLLSETSI